MHVRALLKFLRLREKTFEFGKRNLLDHDSLENRNNGYGPGRQSDSIVVGKGFHIPWLRLVQHLN